MQIQEVIPIPEKSLSSEEYREWITSLENGFKETAETYDRHTSITAGCKLEHCFTEGMYMRELTMPKGMLVISRIHLQQHPFVISKGKVSIYDGERVETLTAPAKGVTQPGTKRILFPHEETVLTTFHPTDKTTLEEVDADGVITCETYEQFDQIKGLPCHSSPQP